MSSNAETVMKKPTKLEIFIATMTVNLYTLYAIQAIFNLSVQFIGSFYRHECHQHASVHFSLTENRFYFDLQELTPTD